MSGGDWGLRLAVAVDDFVPWTEEAHNEIPGWRLALDTHNATNDGRPMVATFSGAQHGVDSRVSTAATTDHLTPAQALAAKVWRPDNLPLGAVGGAGAPVGAPGAAPPEGADSQYDGFLGFAPGDRSRSATSNGCPRSPRSAPRCDCFCFVFNVAPPHRAFHRHMEGSSGRLLGCRIETVTFYPHLPSRTFVDTVAFTPAGGGKPVHFGREAQAKAMQVAAMQRHAAPCSACEPFSLFGRSCEAMPAPLGLAVGLHSCHKAAAPACRIIASCHHATT